MLAALIPPPLGRHNANRITDTFGYRPIHCHRCPIYRRGTITFPASIITFLFPKYGELLKGILQFDGKDA